MSGQAHFEVFPERVEPNGNPAYARGQWRWRLRAANGEIVASSEGYTTQTDAERGASDLCKAVESMAFGTYSGGAEIEAKIEVVES